MRPSIPASLPARRLAGESFFAMITDHAIVEREGFKVPLIGIPTESVLQECDCCYEEKPIREVELSETGQMLCEKCRKP